MGKEIWQQNSFIDDGTLISEATKRRRQSPPDRKLREAIEQYVDVPTLRQYASDHERLTDALKTGEIPEELHWILSMLATVLAPIDREQVKSPSDVASHLMLKIGHECQEQFCVVCLNTRNRVQKIETVYKGTLNSSNVRITEVFREPMKLNSAAVIFAHSHPSGDVTPSPEDVLVTRELVAAGRLLDIDPLDHLIVSQNKWLSMREKGLGFDK